LNDPYLSLSCERAIVYDVEESLMTPNLISAWQVRFRKAAEADQMDLLRRHLETLELPGEPELLLRGTLAMVPMSLVYHQMDGNEAETFLDRQTDDPSRARNATYLLTPDLYGRVAVAESSTPRLIGVHGKPGLRGLSPSHLHLVP
jgi:hypothetical protein